MFLRQAFAFIKRDLQIEASYRFSFIMDIFGVITTLLTFYFIGRLFEGRVAPHLIPYGGDYFSYVLLGLTLSNYIGTSLSGITAQINNEQAMGTLEALLVTPAKVWQMLIAMNLFEIISNTIESILYILFGIFLFGVDLTSVNLISCLIIFFLTIVSFSGLGLVSAAFVLVFKRGNPVGWLMAGSLSLLGGVYFPVTVFPLWLKNISLLLPITYSIQAMQLAVYKGYSPAMLFSHIKILSLFCIILVPVGLVSFAYALKKAKSDGSLIHY